MAKVTELVAALAAPIAEQNGCTLWDVEYVREAGQWFLRVYIDKPEGISINDCEAVSRPLSDALDEADPIEGSYVLEVSSAGADRPLKKPAHFQRFLGAEVDVRLYRPLDGRKEYTGVLKGYLFKDAVKNRVFVTDTPQKGAKTCETRYRTLTKRGGLSLVECELITGRTHQIRAQFAHAGHPLLGDGKYGKLDPHADRRYQALYSYRLTFCFTTDAGVLAPLNGRSFQVADVEFVKTYFPDFRLPGIAE